MASYLDSFFMRNADEEIPSEEDMNAEAGPLAALARVNASSAPTPSAFKPETSKVQGALTGSLLKDQRLRGDEYARPLSAEDFAAERARARKLMAEDERDIPVASVPVQRDAAAPTTGVIAPTTGTRAAEGAGGDTDEMDRLSSAANWIRAMETAGSAISGKNLRSGIADSLSDRMKQVEALRLKKAEKAEEQAREDEQSASLVQQYKSLAAQGLVPDLPLLDKLPPKQAASLIKTYGSLGGMKAREQKTQAEIPQVEARTEDLRAGAELKKAKTPEVALEGESKRLKREQDAAIGWARVNQASAEAAARAAASLASTAASQAEAKAADEQLKRIEKIIKGAGYTPLIASLEQADQAISDLGRPPTATAQLKHALPGGDRFLSPEEKAYYNSVDKLKQMEQLAISGKVVSVQEREEFIRQYGTNWYANPAAAEAYIDMLRKKTARQIDLDLASVRASPAGKKAVEAYAREGGVTSALPVFKGATAAARPEKPATAPAGKTVLWNVAEGKWKAIPNENAEAAVASGKYER
jgi:hypothetical protein